MSKVLVNLSICSHFIFSYTYKELNTILVHPGKTNVITIPGLQ